MTPIVKRQVNAGYRWLEQNPVTGILLSAGVSVAVTIAAVGALGLYSANTFQAKTACSDPASEKCANQRLEVAKAEPLRNPCASYQRVTSRRGRNCAHFYVDPGPMGAAPSKFQADSGPAGGRDADQGDQGDLHEGATEVVPGGEGHNESPEKIPAAPPTQTPVLTPPAAPTTPAPSPKPSRGPIADAVVPTVEGAREAVCNLTPAPCEALPMPVVP